VAIIAMFVESVLYGPTSLRATSAVLNLFFTACYRPQLSLPCPNTGRLWVLRLGLYELTRPKEKADDWVWITDHTIQISSVKCLLIVGCRLSQWQRRGGPLGHQDLQVLALEPVERSNGEVVCEQLERTVEVTGMPREILSDGGPDLNRGISLFGERHPQLAKCYDVAHKMALFLKKVLTKDPRWQEFLKKMAQSKKQFVHSSLAFLTPPKVPDQARYMNLEALLKWAKDLRRFMDDPEGNNGSLVEPWRVRMEFEWLRAFDDVFPLWQRLFDVVQITLQFVRSEGYHQGAGTTLRGRLADHRGHPQSDEFIEQVVGFVEEQSVAANGGERLIGSTECLESLIGKGKRLEGQQSRSGFTAMVLAVPAAVVGPTHDVIEAAMAAVKTKDVFRWARDKLGLSVQARRRRAFQAARKEQNRDNPQISTSPGF
jgi:hypothetical protein